MDGDAEYLRRQYLSIPFILLRLDYTNILRFNQIFLNVSFRAI